MLHYGDRPWNTLTISMAVLTIVLVIMVGVLLWKDSAGARSAFGLNFLKPTNDASWNPVSSEFQAWPFIYGTIISSLLSLVIAVPISLGAAIFLAELCPEKLRITIGGMFELLAAIPSVIYGLWGIFVFLPKVVAPSGNFLGATLGKLPVLNLFLHGPVPSSGASLLAAALILSIMIIPTITAITRDVLLAIPSAQREASLALGSTQWETISKVLIPYGLSGILGAVILGLGRALGETMAVTMVVGNSIGGSLSLLRPGYTMSSIIANEFAEAASPLHTQALIEIGLILFVITLLLNILARLLEWRVSRRSIQEVRA
ncbi:MAG: phosphate ABC transporter permease subunit PstC [Anaerolineales bacterium]|nr:phosphate ABC transporter permease subunit PstC [Anaerolineae bacterium]PWB55769.1 MAG: phosphate ABC transporter permease subunit PstC [Anaerolineales bacterium]